MRANNVVHTLLLVCTLLLGEWSAFTSAVSTDGFKKVTRGRFPNFRRAVDSGIPVYTGPKDDDNVATMDGVRDYAKARWPALTSAKDTIFFTGFRGGIPRDLAEAFKNHIGADKSFWFEDAFPRRGDQDPDPAIFMDQLRISDDDKWKTFARASQVYAEMSAGTAWILINKNLEIDDPYPGSDGKFANWVFFEFNTLTRSGNIEKIIRVNPDDFDDQETVWNKGDEPFGDAPDGASGDKPNWKSQPLITIKKAADDADA